MAFKYRDYRTGELVDSPEPGVAFQKVRVEDGPEPVEEVKEAEAAETKEQDVTGENKSAVGQFWDKLTTPKGRITMPPAEPVVEPEPEDEAEEVVEDDESEGDEFNN